MKTIKFIFLITLIFSSLLNVAQDETTSKEAPFQITFIPPLGTNGINGANTINKLSYNILAGYAAGVDGVEIGGVANINREFVKGAQFAGFTNISGGDVTGIQFAGFANINNGQTNGIQVAGFTNINNGTSSGFQGSGFLNITRKESKVVQISGFGNIASGSIEGAQISGFINVAKKVNGVQIGFINVADTIENGIPIGFISIVKNGFREFEVGFSEGLNSYTSFKIGVNKFYNIFSIGMQNVSDKFRWGFGYGIGSQLSKNEKLQVNLELMSYHINEGTNFTNRYNDLLQMKFTFAKPIGKNISLFAGPSINLMISDYENKFTNNEGSNFAPYHISNQWSGNTNLKYWFGFNAGLRIH